MRRGLVIAAAILVLDQITKAAILDLMQPPRVIEVLPVFNLVLAMNRGVSFSLFAGHADAPLLLSGLAAVLIAALLWWLRTAEHPLTRTAIGLVVGGAVGNLIDRVRYGAVVDFLDAHWGDWHWPAFNVADSAITVGALLLMFDALFSRPQSR
ncbi:Lipoprotein signal peptidase [uncultured Alphaproteobacteria bacterium]|uniref:Lipoprotein signal peptidase n=1 Tax=uncultured Alphaproteobacteria bacterium TaxID=91750 RepID=A0A212KLG9_9PROT|nr:Lipoprotein signal peptidase [uncultured Alphaproteobacteria bacterium]